MLGYCSSLALSHFFAQSIISCQRKLRFIIRAWQHISPSFCTGVSTYRYLFDGA